MPVEGEKSSPARLPDKVERILFVCTGNSCRSVMAEGIFNKWALEKGLRARASSAGISALDGLGPTEETVLTLKKDGIDMSAHRCRRLTREMIHDADIVFAMDIMHRNFILQAIPEAEGKIFLMTEFYQGEDRKMFRHGVPDPIGMNREFYSNVMEMISRSVAHLVKTLEACSARGA